MGTIDTPCIGGVTEDLEATGPARLPAVALSQPPQPERLTAADTPIARVSAQR
jgi:hypothetical protein